MLTVKATETKRYADKKPYKPQHELSKGMFYNSRDLPIDILKRAIELGFAEEVESHLEIPEVDDIETIEPVLTEVVEEKTHSKVKVKRRRG